MKLNEKQSYNFWSRVEISETNFYKNTPCWEWIGKRNKQGYGVCSLLGQKTSHRVSWVLYNGDIPENKPHVLHHCDNPSCINPGHLWLGTHQDNMTDKANKGRCNIPTGDRHGSRTCIENRPRGDKNGASKLKWFEVDEIRKLYESGEYQQTTLAEMFDVTSMNISLIVNYKNWKKH